ncbi:MAG: response regulator, partial [Kamptonema sp. SIO4C4]|nr:response regulator [Kamptonema sp. SIO4C4]
MNRKPYQPLAASEENNTLSHKNDDSGHDSELIQDDEEVLFTPEEEETPSDNEENTWKILLVDDEPEIHQVTQLALHDFAFEGKKLVFLSAYSGEEAKQIITEHNDIAMIFLDVIMEHENAGLDVVHYVREILGNKLVRIVLRTGQPGKVPEDVIILKYDINDYKVKTELTRKKLLTKVITSLRGYSTLQEIEKSKADLERIALENAQLYSKLEEYASTLEQKVTERTQELEEKNCQLEKEILERKRIEKALQKANLELNRLANLDSLTQVANHR